MYGTPITDWTPVTASFGVDTGSLGTSTTTCFRRQVGDSYEYSARLAFTGAAGTWTGLYFQLPSGDVIDTTKLTAGFRGTARFNDLGVSEYSGFLRQRNSSSFFIFPNAVVTHTGTAPVVTTQNSNTFPFSMASGDEIVVNVEVPIVGLSSSVQVSDGYDGRIVAGAAYRVTTNQTGVNPNNSQVKIQINGLGVNNLDTVGGFDLTNNRYVVKTSGTYRINAGIAVASTNVLANIYTGRIVVNGTTPYPFCAVTPTVATTFSLTGSVTINLNAGDYVELFLFGTGNNSTNTLTVASGNITNLTLEKLSGSSTISATETVAFHAAGTAGDAISTGLTVIKFTTKEDDTHNAYNVSTGVFTAPYTGRYNVSAAIETASVNISTTQVVRISLYKNGSAYRGGHRSLGNGVANVHTSSLNVNDVYLTAGQTLEIRGFSSVATTVSTDPVLCYFSVTMVK